MRLTRRHVDVKRVIRHLGSLHGKSGLEVTEIPFDRLDPDGSHHFDPLKEAVVFGGSEDKRIRLLTDDVRAVINQREIGEALVTNSPWTRAWRCSSN